MKKFLSLVLALIMVMSLVTVGAGAADFTDAEEITQTEAVAVLTGLGIVNGYADDTFRPNATLTRGAAAKIICIALLGDEMAALLECDEAPFSDVAADSTFAPYISYLAGEGIVNGYTDGTFKPKATLSGYAFAKMLLGALEIEGEYTGTNWKYNVAIAAGKADLLDGVDTLVGDIAREDACQLALNAIIYTPEGEAEYYVVFTDSDNDNEYDTGETVLYKGNDATTALLMKLSTNKAALTTETSYAGSWGDANWDLVSNTAADDFGRKSTVWSNGLATTDDDYVEYAAIAEEPVLTYTAKVARGKIASALGCTKATDTVTLKVIVDGDADNAVTYEDVDKSMTSTTTYGIGGAGTLVEVYETDDEDVYNVIVINTYAAVLEEDDVVEYDEDTDTDAYVSITHGGNELTYDTEDFLEGDVVLYTVGNGEIQNVVLADYVSGYITASASSYIRVDGEKYTTAANKLSAGVYTYAKADSDSVYTCYLDNYGNVIYTVAGETADIDTKYTYVIKAASAYDEGSASNSNLFEASADDAAAQVKVIDLATGAISVKNIAIVTNTAGKLVYATKSGAASAVLVDDKLEDMVEAGIYEYVELDNGSIVLVDGNSESANWQPAATMTVTVEEGVAAIADATYATSATKLTVVKYSMDDDEEEIVSASVTVSTGIASFPESAKTYTGALVITDEETGLVTDILVVTESSSTKTVNYAIYNAVGETDADGTKHTFYVDGSSASYYVEDTAGNDLAKYYVYDITVSDGVVTAAKKIDAANTNMMTVVAVDDTFILAASTSGTVYTIYFDEDGCAVYDQDNSYKATTLAVDDEILVFGVAKNDATWTGADLILVDSDQDGAYKS